MRPGREIDARIAKEIFGHKVWAQAKVLYENAPKGDRPLRNYSKEMEWAWEVIEKMKVTLIPIEGGQWFAFVGPQKLIGEKNGWESPDAVLKFLEAKQFEDCGAAVGDNVPLLVCQASLIANEKRLAAAGATNDVNLEQEAAAPMNEETSNVIHMDTPVQTH
jgi:hypothetical protein